MRPYTDDLSRSGASNYSNRLLIKCEYQGCSINKLQNNAIPPVLKIGKIWNIRCAGNSILNIHTTFLDDDVIIVTSSDNRTQLICVLFSPLMEWHHFVTYLWNDPRIILVVSICGSLPAMACWAISLLYCTMHVCQGAGTLFGCTEMRIWGGGMITRDDGTEFRSNLNTENNTRNT